MKNLHLIRMVTMLVLAFAAMQATTVQSAGPNEPITVANAKLVRSSAKLAPNADEVYSLAFNPDGSLLATGHRDLTIHLWNTTTHEEQSVLKDENDLGGASYLQYHGGVIYLRFATETSLFSGTWLFSTAKVTRYWDIKTSKMTPFGKEFAGLIPGITAVAISSDGKLVAHEFCRDINFTIENGSSCMIAGVKIKDAKSEEELAVLEPSIEGGLWALEFSPDNKWLAATGSDGGVRLIDTKTGKISKTLGKLSKPTLGIAFNSDGSLVAVAAADGSVRLWNVKTGAAVSTLKASTAAAVVVAFNRDGTLLASAGVDKSIHLWDMKTKRQIVGLKSHKDTVSALAFSPDGTLLASGSYDGTLVLWGLAKK